jgi:hypothetical protein
MVKEKSPNPCGRGSSDIALLPALRSPCDCVFAVAKGEMMEKTSRGHIYSGRRRDG